MSRIVNADVVLAAIDSALATRRERGARAPLEVSILRRRLSTLRESIDQQAVDVEVGGRRG